ncbi:hypothetical protein AB0C52_28930, partial [Streptomyces sp. NPDC048717]|uniref:hypothetical protein n=1 Tax=Streptomyces sp. NPDC048717 TaxID=3154928 RepID=UPI003421D73E
IMLPVLRAVDDRLREAAAVLGASPWRAWREAPHDNTASVWSPRSHPTRAAPTHPVRRAARSGAEDSCRAWPRTGPSPAGAPTRRGPLASPRPESERTPRGPRPDSVRTDQARGAITTAVP